ncbi:MAG: aminotransferase class I/II-fold pyridoxal phosphate-dependent enzyme [Bacteroidales bacterium]|nr:aminotransferase class I/II-fold pyridoxal phosphate-dependent enzyme [Bacteroidales bacterium]
MLRGHGDNGYLFNTEIKADFSSNVYFKGPSKGLLNHLSKSIQHIGNYPEVVGESSNALLAEKHNINSSNILISNGATEAFYMLALLYKKCSSTIFVPSFSEYADACNVHDHRIHYLTNTILSNKLSIETKLVWLCNPNNPDGKIIEPNYILSLCKKYPETIFIIDEAYADFVSQDISVINHVSEQENLIVVKSLTKKYAIPGLRLGYIAAHDSIITKLLAVKMPWSNNTLALSAVKYTLQQNDDNFDLLELLLLSRSLQNELSKINGIKVFTSNTSFFLIKTKHTSKKVFDYLLEKYGILVRNASNFQGLDNHYIRICTQNQTKNQLLIKVLKQWMRE